MAEAWLVLTHDGRLPGPGAPRVWWGETCEERDGAGHGVARCWALHRELSTALATSGLWPLGRPSMAVKVGVPRDATIPSSSSLCDAPGLNVLAHASENEITAAIYEVSTKFFGACGGEMAGEQVTWRLALARATWNPAVVEAGLRAALIARGLGDWQLETFDTAAAVWSAWMQFASRNPVEALEARDCWGYNDALEARQIWSARGVGANWRAWEPWTTTSQEHKLDERTIGSVAVQRDFGAAKAAYAAHFALTLWFASRQGWVQKPADLLAVGLRESYAQGLEMAMPIRPRILGWAMALSAQLPQAGVHS